MYEYVQHWLKRSCFILEGDRIGTFSTFNVTMKSRITQLLQLEFPVWHFQQRQESQCVFCFISSDEIHIFCDKIENVMWLSCCSESVFLCLRERENKACSMYCSVLAKNRCLQTCQQRLGDVVTMCFVFREFHEFEWGNMKRTFLELQRFVD